MLTAEKHPDADKLRVLSVDPGNGKPPVQVDYRVHPAEDGSLKVFDIIVEGVSLITTQRSEFGSVVQNQGIDALIRELTARSQATAPMDLSQKGA